MSGVFRILLAVVLTASFTLSGCGLLQGSASYDRPGFVTAVDDEGRLWVFREGSEEAEILEEGNFPDKHFTMPGKGPDGLTIKTLDRETAIAYLGLED